MANPYDKYFTHEDKLQMAVIEYLARQYPDALVHHSPNEGKRSNFERYKAKKMGVKSGFPDLLIIRNRVVLALELKTGANKPLKIAKGKPTPNQYAWIDRLNSNGISAVIVYGFDEAKKVIDATLKRAA